MRHMLMQISPLSDLVRQVIWGLCRAASRTLRTLDHSGESLRVWTVDRLTQRARRLSGAGASLFVPPLRQRARVRQYGNTSRHAVGGPT